MAPNGDQRNGSGGDGPSARSLERGSVIVACALLVTLAVLFVSGGGVGSKGVHHPEHGAFLPPGRAVVIEPPELARTVRNAGGLRGAIGSVPVAIPVGPRGTSGSRPVASGSPQPGSPRGLGPSPDTPREGVRPAAHHRRHGLLHRPRAHHRRHGHHGLHHPAHHRGHADGNDGSGHGDGGHVGGGHAHGGSGDQGGHGHGGDGGHDGGGRHQRH
jgi:hypothetical protein